MKHRIYRHTACPLPLLPCDSSNYHCKIHFWCRVRGLCSFVELVSLNMGLIVWQISDLQSLFLVDTIVLHCLPLCSYLRQGLPHRRLHISAWKVSLSHHQVDLRLCHHNWDDLSHPARHTFELARVQRNPFRMQSLGIGIIWSRLLLHPLWELTTCVKTGFCLGKTELIQ